MQNLVICLRYFKHGVFTKKILAKLFDLRFKSTRSHRCTTGDGSNCEPPEEKPDPKKPLECDPPQEVCTKGCMPWEEAVELCPTKKPRVFDTKVAVDDCDKANIQEDIGKKKEMNACEQRLYEKCLKIFKKPADECMKEATRPQYKDASKEYPMMHAVSKKSLPGAPKTGWQRISNAKYPDCEE